MISRERKIIRTGLFVVLILSLTALSFILFGSHSKDAENARTLTVLKQYMNALELVRLDLGTYPLTNDFVCLGDYADDFCWDKEGAGVGEDEALGAALRHHVPLLSVGPLVEDDNRPGESREGYVYRSRDAGKGYEIQYLLQGPTADCGFGEELSVGVATRKVEGNTLCTIIR